MYLSTIVAYLGYVVEGIRVMLMIRRSNELNVSDACVLFGAMTLRVI